MNKETGTPHQYTSPSILSFYLHIQQIRYTHLTDTIEYATGNILKPYTLLMSNIGFPSFFATYITELTHTQYNLMVKLPPDVFRCRSIRLKAISFIKTCVTNKLKRDEVCFRTDTQWS